MRSNPRSTVKTFDELATRLKVADTIWVTDAQGREIQGTLRELRVSSLTLESGGAVVFDADAVRVIEKRKAK